MSPGASAVPLASIVVLAPAVSISFSLPTAWMTPLMATTVSASRMGWSRSPLKRSPILRITSLVDAVELAGASWAMDLCHPVNTEAAIIRDAWPRGEVCQPRSDGVTLGLRVRGRDAPATAGGTPALRLKRYYIRRYFDATFFGIRGEEEAYGFERFY